MTDRVRKPNAIQRYFAETSGELRKVSWPTWPEARQLTFLVIIVMIVVGSAHHVLFNLPKSEYSYWQAVEVFDWRPFLISSLPV